MLCAVGGVLVGFCCVAGITDKMATLTFYYNTSSYSVSLVIPTTESKAFEILFLILSRHCEISPDME